MYIIFEFDGMKSHNTAIVLRQLDHGKDKHKNFGMFTLLF